jgi:hypothetical protein
MTHHARAQATPSAGECIGDYTVAKLADGFDFCLATQAFALCIAKAPPSNSVKQAEAVLTEAQEASRINCNIKVTPSIKVVDREVRVVG